MKESTGKGRPRTPRRTRTDRDWVMMVLGVLLIVFFVVAGYAALNGREDAARSRKRGPVKDPKAAAVVEGQRLANNVGCSVWIASSALVAKRG